MKIALAVIAGVILSALAAGGGFMALFVLTLMHDSPKTAQTAMPAMALLALGGLAAFAAIWLGVAAVIIETSTRGLLIAAAFAASSSIACIVGAFALPFLALR